MRWRWVRSSASSAGWGYSSLTNPNAAAPPSSCISTNIGTEAGAMPAKVSENIRPTLIAGFAKLVELVKK